MADRFIRVGRFSYIRCVEKDYFKVGCYFVVSFRFVVGVRNVGNNEVMVI